MTSNVPALDPALLEESAEDLYEAAPAGYMSILTDGTIVKANKAIVQWTKLPKERLLGGTRFQDLLTLPGRIFYETHFSPLLHMQGYVNEIAFDFVTSDGNQLPVLLNASLKHGPQHVQVVRITIFNASDRRRYEQELLAARRKAEQFAQARADLLHMISHDVRAPLTAITASLELVRKIDLPDRARKYFDIMSSGAKTLLDLTNTILDYSRIEAGMVTLERKPFAFRPVVTDVIRTFEAAAATKSIELMLEIEESIPSHLVGDPVKLSQILTNLMGNAVKFTSVGSVRLSIKQARIRSNTIDVAFTVADTGIGIPNDRLNRIFDDFSQAGPDIAKRYGGTGLGLSITKRLIELQGGLMAVESSVGKGSSFRFELSFEQAPSAT